MSSKPSLDQLQGSIHVICKVISQIPCYHLYEKHVAGRFTTGDSDVSLAGITHNAALDSALINLRCFNEFFSANRQKDDIRASDFPGIVMQPFLRKDDKTAIQKYLAHITITRSDVATKPWFLDEMVVFGLRHGVTFLSTIETTFPPSKAEDLAELRGVRDAARLLSLVISKIDRSRNT
jgi:hypothetical protein